MVQWRKGSHGSDGEVTVVLRSARLKLLEMEEAVGDEDLPLLLMVQKSLLLM